MKKVWFVRHGESMANAGQATRDHRSIPLTQQGWSQARAVSITVPRPELIIVSPYLRARQTAEPLCQRYPDVPVECWDEVHEFVYLSPATCVGTTSSQRRPRVLAYWKAVDRAYVDGEWAESYQHLLERIYTTLSRLEEREQQFIVVFSHAQFMRNLHLVMSQPGLTPREYMALFRKSRTIRNGQIMEIRLPYKKGCRSSEKA